MSRVILIFILASTALCSAVWFSLSYRKSASTQQAAMEPSAWMERVTRQQTLALAERYVHHQWSAAERNAFHGLDADGIRVDTPNDGFVNDQDKEKGWWLPNQVNTGIPYKWGGFDLPEEFDAGLREGKFAGDVYSQEKRRLLDDAVSQHAVGIDCSGFISRCWRLPRSYSTRELPQLCDPVPDPAQLKPGDIFNKHNAHVRLFAGWADEARTEAITYEAAIKVQRHQYPVAEMLAEGYSAWRYRNISD